MLNIRATTITINPRMGIKTYPIKTRPATINAPINPTTAITIRKESAPVIKSI